MKRRYTPELIFLILVIILSIAGFWNIYFGDSAKPNGFHHLHIITNLAWLFLLSCQLSLIERKNFSSHRQLGLAIFLMGPMLFASVALLSVHSANRASLADEPDMLVVQNVLASLELGLIIFLGFLLRKNRKLHGSFLMATALLFMGIALFFVLISFVPKYRIEGPETFYRFEMAMTTTLYISAAVGALFFLKDRKNGWPWLLVGTFFFMNAFIGSQAAKYNGIRPLTDFIGSLSHAYTFILSFICLLFLLILAWKVDAGWIHRRRERAKIH